MTDVTQAPDPIVYVPYAQAGWPTMSIVVRLFPGFANEDSKLRQAIRAVDSSRPVYNMQHVAATIADRLALRRVQTLLISVFGIAAFSLAFVGVYSVVAFSVKQREREFGIRLAIGATERQVTFDVLRETGRQVIVAAIVGLWLAIAGGSLVGSMMVGVSAWNPLAIATMLATLAIGALLASYLPARRASLADAIGALRTD